MRYLYAWADVAPGSPAPSKSLSGCDEGQDEEDQLTGGAPTPQYTQREKWLIRETYKKEIRRGNLFNPVLPATWKPFHHLVSLFETDKNGLF